MSKNVAKIPPNIQNFIDVVVERYGYYFGKRKIQSELFKATKEERSTIRNLRKTIQNLVNEMVYDGKDNRKAIKELQRKLFDARNELKRKATPYYEKIRPLTKAISLMDKEIIPQKIQEITGKPLEPRYTLSEWLRKKLTEKEQKKNKQKQ